MTDCGGFVPTISARCLTDFGPFFSFGIVNPNQFPKGQNQEKSYVFPFVFVILQVKFPHMKNSTSYEPIKDYQTPSLRVIEADLELSFLQSNLEPIGGGDDPDIDW